MYYIYVGIYIYMRELNHNCHTRNVHRVVAYAIRNLCASHDPHWLLCFFGFPWETPGDAPGDAYEV